MYIYAYLRASTLEQDALRAKNRLKEFAGQHGQHIAGWYVENASGASLDSPELTRMLSDMESGDVILIEQVDRLSRLSDDDWDTLKRRILEKDLSVIRLYLPTSLIALTHTSMTAPAAASDCRRCAGQDSISHRAHSRLAWPPARRKS